MIKIGLERHWVLALTLDYQEALAEHEGDGGWLFRHQGGYVVCDEDEAVAVLGHTKETLDARHRAGDWVDPPYDDAPADNPQVAAIRWLLAHVVPSVASLPGYAEHREAIEAAASGEVYGEVQAAETRWRRTLGLA